MSFTYFLTKPLGGQGGSLIKLAPQLRVELAFFALTL